FYRHRCLCSLHSFPTRRSSDLLAADLLVSPRSRGTNTPLKIYQYLRSGRATVATRLLTHTQVLSDETAILTGATAREFADGVLADRKSTRLNSSHVKISYAVFC